MQSIMIFLLQRECLMIKAKVFIFIVKTFYIIIVTRYSLLQVEFMFQNQIAQISLSKHRLVIELLMYLVFMKSISRTDKKAQLVIYI